MKRLQHVWDFVLREPFIWLYRYFIKTNAFMSEVTMMDRAARLKLLLRLTLPMFLVSYPLALLLSLMGMGTAGDFHFDSYLLLQVAVGLLSGFLIGTTWDVVMNRPVGILAGMWLGIWLGMWAAISWLTWTAILLTTIGGIALGGGVVKSIGKITVKSLEENQQYWEDFSSRYDTITNQETSTFAEWAKLRLEIASEFIGRSMSYLIGGAAPSIEQNRARRIGITVTRCIVVSTIGLVIVLVLGSIIKDLLNIMGSIWWAVTMGSLAGILAGVTLGHTRNKLADLGIGIGSGIVIEIMLGNFQPPTVPVIVAALTPAIVTAIAWGITMSRVYRGAGIAGHTSKPNLLIFSIGMALGIITGYLGGGWAIILFPLCYFISYCQLPLWLLSFFSIKTAVRAASKNPSEVFVQLYASPLYWDKWEVLPLPDQSEFDRDELSLQEWLVIRLDGKAAKRGLGNMMELATEQDIEQAMQVLTFIEAERPFQFETARLGAREGFLKFIAREEKSLKEQDDISGVIEHFNQLQTFVIKLDTSDSPRWLRLLEMMMAKVIEQDIEQAIAALPLIKTWQSSELAAVEVGLRNGFLQLVAHEMEPQETLRDITETTQQFTNLQALSVRMDIFDLNEGGLISFLDEVFRLLHDVCRDATHYLNSLRWQARHDALANMLANLTHIGELVKRPLPVPDIKEILSPSPFSSVSSKREENKQRALDNWAGIVRHKLSELEQEPRKTDQIDNPYVVGQVLQRGTPLFVGRQDIVRQLEQSLRQGSHRPTFFLNGERRMGKSSTLRQLPSLLDARRFLPISFDLLAPGMTSSIAIFLGTIAEKISETIESEGMQVEPLAIKHLQEAQQKNEASVYHAFDEWLKQVACVLEQNNRVVLLSFDEFENLEIAGKAKYLDLHLLLNWFRSVIQNRPQLALLFSGGKSVSEMSQETDLNWSGYFVNVQTLKVSFLQNEEARHLITRPKLDYPIEQIFGTGVVDEIIRVTSCHPFLVQAVCSNLVDNLNADNRNRVEIQDVAVAVTEVLKRWEDGYFEDLWTRSDPEQQACLIALSELGKSDIQQIAQYIHRNKEITRENVRNVRHALQVLLKRDLVSLENETYRMATPIFSQWVERRIGSNS